MNAADPDSLKIPRHRGSTVAFVLKHLRDGILNGRYAPGQRLIESDLTRDLGVSRGPLREAFRRLSAEGLIEIVPNRGALVRRLSFRETMELFEIRTELEALAARRAALNIDSGDTRARFEAAIAAIWRDDPRLSAVAYIEENKAFHHAIAEASGNRELALLGRQMQLPLIMFHIMFNLSGTHTVEMLTASVSEHRRIATAILAGDAATAEAEVRAHLSRAAEVTRDMPASIFRP